MTTRLREITDCFRRGLQPPPPVVDWLSREIKIPRAMSARASGPFSLHRRRFQADILEAWHPQSGVNEVTIAGAAQDVGKTTMGILGLAYRLKHQFWPTLITSPNAKTTEDKIGQLKLVPLIDENPVLSSLKPADDDKYKRDLLQMTPGPIFLVGANSPTGLASASCGIVMIEEAAKIQHNHHEDAPDAHPIHNAWARSKDFRTTSYFHWMVCSPTSPTHPFWVSVEGGTMSRFHVECPRCREWFPFDFIGRKEDVEEYGKLIGKELPAEYRSIVWDRTARSAGGEWDMDRVGQTARYICPHNGCVLAETDHAAMLDTVQRRDHNPFAPKRHRSYVIPGLYSAAATFGSFAQEFIKAQSQLIVALEPFFNSWRATTWEELDRNVKEDAVLRCKSDYPRRTVPGKPIALVLTADPGGIKGTNWAVTAIMPNADLAVIDWGVIGKPEQLLDRTFIQALRYPIAGGTETISPNRGYIDAGYITETIYSICSASRGAFQPMMGANTRTGGWWEREVASHPGMKRIDFCDHTAKLDLYARRIFERVGPKLLLPADAYHGTPGRSGNTAHLDDPQSYAALVAGLSGQKLITVNGAKVWKKIPHDDYGDTIKMALVISWVGAPLTTQRFTGGRDYVLQP